MTILASVYSLAKNNNGFFKSEKQAKFLISQLESMNGAFVESFSFGEFNGAKALRTVFVSWDSKGITQIKTVADVSRKESVKFTRISETDFADKQAQKQAEKEASRLQSIADYQRLIAEQQSMIDSKAAYNASLLEKAQQSTAVTPELIEGLKVSLSAMLEIETRDQQKMIKFYTEAMQAYM